MSEPRSDGQIGADALDDRVSYQGRSLDELGDMFATLSVLVDRLLVLQESMEKRLTTIEEREDQP